MPRTMTHGQRATFEQLKRDTPRLAHVREAWDGKTLCVGFGLEENPVTRVSSTLMYRIEPERILVVAVIHGSRDLGSLGEPWDPSQR